ncbi:LacI family DNA-binding transcriptional regulator [Streptomyces sp. NPDC001691]|uniref:LacI family DNA-binding transcriptional regulator n=1 Tax=unclassified Streptomyces TaxID=2593676 RepID=UPI000DE876D8|nr:LacI family DNA-binding transcriptional regulator [Streptomyces sp. SDr-06]RCH64021.1 LacI family DNA-binding transcriptional regulator [Streptomyces sp. SDr-06]
MAGKNRPATLQGIAEQLGLHVSTVSRVLNGPAGERGRAASGKTADRIRKLAHELGYQPNPHATSLRTHRSNLIGVLFPRLAEIVVATIYEGVEEEAARHGLSTFVANTRDDPAVQRERLAMVLGRRVDGVIIGDAHLDGAALADPALRAVPFVLVNRHAPNAQDAAGLITVTCDDHLGGRLMAEHLLSLGHRDVAVIAGEPFASTGADRTAGFLERYREAGLPLPAHRVRHCHFDTRGGRAAATELLHPLDRPTALFAVNDFAAIGAMGAARDMGLRIGQDVALGGFNDTPLAAELPIPLTSVHSPMAEQGKHAVQQLVRLIARKPAASQRLRPVLTPRASTGRPVGPDLT